MDIFTLIFSMFTNIISIFASNIQADDNNYYQSQENEIARDWQHDERIEQNEYAQQMHEFNVANDPRILKNAYRGLGMSEAAALQAIAGGSLPNWNPSSGSSGSAPLSAIPTSLPYTGFQGIQNALNSYFENRLKESQTNKNEQDIVYSKQMIDESNARIVELGHRMGIDDQYIQLATALNNSVIGLNSSQEQLNIAKLNEVDMQIEKLFSEIQNIDADTINKYLEASKINAETINIKADTVYKESLITLTSAQAEYVNSQTEGQNLANDDQRIIGSLRKARYEVSKVLGVDIDSDLTSNYLIAMATGNYNSVARLIEAKQNTDNSMLGNYANSKTINKVNKTRKKQGNKKYSTRSIYGLEPSFEGIWNPFE